MKHKKMKFFLLEIDKTKDLKCYACKKKNTNCKCKDCKFCGSVNRKDAECRYCKKKHIVDKVMITNAELNALEDLGLVDLKTMFNEKREKEVEIWQDRCRVFWHRIIKKIDE